MDDMAICERCSEEIEVEEVQKCEICGYDGLCPDCLNEHSCDEN